MWQEFCPGTPPDPDFYQVFHAEFTGKDWEIQQVTTGNTHHCFPQVVLSYTHWDDAKLHWVYTEGTEAPYEIKYGTKDKRRILSLFSGRIAESTEWTRDIYITGDVWVDSGVTLTIKPGVTVYFAPNQDDQKSGLDTNRCELIVNGSLVAIGTEADSVRFTSSSLEPKGSDWYGIRFTYSSTDTGCIIDHSIIEYGIRGISCEEV